MEYIFILFWTFSAVMARCVAQYNGRNGLAWFLAGLLFGPVGFTVILLPPLKRREEEGAGAIRGSEGVYGKKN